MVRNGQHVEFPTDEATETSQRQVGSIPGKQTETKRLKVVHDTVNDLATDRCESAKYCG